MSNLNETNTTMEKFINVMKDFGMDILNTFPEFKDKIPQGLTDIMIGNHESNDVKGLYEYCKKVYQPRFFDFLYQNEKIFNDDTVDTKFLPNIDFKTLWNLDISDNTKDIIWKYLQLICFSFIGGDNSIDNFGEASKLFEAIGENELKDKLQETIEKMSELFESSENGNASDMFKNMDISSALPNVDSLHDNIKNMMQGKLGRLASEITEETMKEFQDLSGASSVSDVFQQLFKDPTRLLKMVNKLGKSLDEKIKSGEIKESELMEEAQEMMKNLKNVPGMKNMQGLLEKMGMGNMMGGKGGKINFGAMNGRLNQNIKTAKMKERMRAKLEKRRQMRAQQEAFTNQNTVVSTGDNDLDELRKQLMQAKQTNEKLNSMLGEKGKKKRRRKKRKGRNKK